MANNAPSLELVNEILKRLGKRSRVVRHEQSSTSVPRWQLFGGDMVHFYETAGGKTLVVLVNHAENGNYVKAISIQVHPLNSMQIYPDGTPRYNARLLFKANDESEYIKY